MKMTKMTALLLAAAMALTACGSTAAASSFFQACFIVCLLSNRLSPILRE